MTFLVKCFQKVCAKSRKFSFINAVFQWSKIHDSSGKGIKREKMGTIDMRISNILLEMKGGFSVKCWQKVCTKLRKLGLKIAFFQLPGGNCPFKHPFFPLQWLQICCGKGIKQEKGGRNLDIIIANILS